MTTSAHRKAVVPIAAAAAIAATTTTLYIVYRQNKKRNRTKSNNETHNHESSNTQASGCIYLDYNGTTPIYPPVLQSMMPYLTTSFGNPSSSHAYGRAPRAAIEEARRSIACLLHPDTVDDWIFCGCGTEADNMAIHLALKSWRGTTNDGVENKKPHVVTCNVEHPAVLECLKYLEHEGQIDVTYLEVDSTCLITPTQITSALTPHTCLVTIMTANNEIGSIFPIPAIAQLCRDRHILFHTDAAQAVGKIDLTPFFGSGGVDMMTIVGHKFGAPKGIAALYVRRGCLEEGEGRERPHGYGTSGSLLLGGGQERGCRAGTENVPYVVAMGAAAALLRPDENFKKRTRRWRELRDALYVSLVSRLGMENLRVNGPAEKKRRLPNTLSVGIRKVHAGRLLRDLGEEVAASAGSACHSGGSEISPVLRAMNVPMEYARGTLRLSVGVDTTMEEVERAAEIIAREVKKHWDEAAKLVFI